MTAGLEIPGLGPMLVSYDKVVITSTHHPARLKHRLPCKELKEAAHAFQILPYRGRNIRMASTITVVGVPGSTIWRILAEHEHELGAYSIVQVEIAGDVQLHELAAEAALKRAMSLLSKRRHQRRHLWLRDRKFGQALKKGCLDLPTVYLEDKNSGVGLKFYARYEKLTKRRFGGRVLRIELTLTRKPALVRHLGGNRLGHLLGANLPALLASRLFLEEVNHAALGRLFHRGEVSDERARRTAHLVLRILAYREHEQGRIHDWGYSLFACQNSPAQIRGYLRQRRDGEAPERRGRPRQRKSTGRSRFTDHRINKCFRRVTAVRMPDNKWARQPKRLNNLLKLKDIDRQISLKYVIQLQRPTPSLSER